MKLLADENIESAMVHWLREQEHNVCWAAESLISTPDNKILEIANASSRILLTRDLDFGELIFRVQRISAGIILLRLRAREQHERLSLLKTWWPHIEANAIGHFLTLTNKRLRIRPLSLQSR